MIRIICGACHGSCLNESHEAACRVCSGRGHIYLNPTPVEIAIERAKRLHNRVGDDQAEAILETLAEAMGDE